MNTAEAKEKLLLYRGRIDDVDPQFAEALQEARGNPELAEWLRRESGKYGALRNKFCEIEPPDDLPEKIIRQRPIPFRRDWTRIWQIAAVVSVFAGLASVWLALSHRNKRQGGTVAAEKEITVRGEVLDMACYIAYNYSGPEHAECARDCIRKGLPVGIKGEDGKTYLLIGATEPANGELADYAAKTVTIRGKATMRDGFAQLEVEEIRKF